MAFYYVVFLDHNQTIPINSIELTEFGMFPTDKSCLMHNNRLEQKTADNPPALFILTEI